MIHIKKVATTVSIVTTYRFGDTRIQTGCPLWQLSAVVARLANVPSHVCEETGQVPLILEPIWVANILANLSKQWKTVKLSDAGGPQPIRNGGARVCWDIGSFVNSTIIILMID